MGKQMDHSHCLVHNFLINILVNIIRKKADNVTSCSRSDLISIFKFTAFCSKFNSFSVSKRRLVNQSVRKLVQSFIKNGPAACYIHPSIQICRSLKHGYGVSVLVNSPSVQAGEVLVREDPLVEVEENECRLLFSDRNDTSVVKDHQFILRKAFTTLAPFQDRISFSCEKENDDVCAQEEKKNAIEQQIIESNVMRYRNVDFSIAGDQDEDDEDEENFTQRNKAKRGIFFFSSRFNHSCQPNALCVFSDISDSSSSSRLTIVALREIKPSEEIFISYSNPLASREEKMKRMGFECCSLVGNGDSNNNTSACNLVDCDHSCVKESGKENENENGKKLAAYVAREIDQLLTNAQKYIHQDNKPTMALKYLLGYLKRTPNFKKLTASHFLRFRLYQEILAAAVGVVSNLNDLEELINDVAHPLLENAKKVLPGNWPTLSGFEMHLAYLLALKMRFKQQHHQEDKNLAETASFVDWWKQTDKESHDKVQNLIEKSKERHEVIFGDEETGRTRWKKFEDRFEMELDCCMGE